MRRWFLKDHFAPVKIRDDPAFFNAPRSYQKVYLLLCRRSYLTQKSPTRRYCEWTYKQLGEQAGLKKRQVGTIMRYLMRNYLIYRWYAGDSGSNTLDGKPRPPRYEIPASRGMINWWRRVRDLHRKIFHKRKEVKRGPREKKESSFNGLHPRQNPIQGGDVRPEDDKGGKTSRPG